MKIKISLAYVLIVIFSLSTQILFAQDFKFAAMSDSRGSDNGVNDPVLSSLVQHLIKNHPDIKFVVFPGDLVSGNRKYPEKTNEQLMHWKDVMSPIYKDTNLVWPKIWLTVGNHEIQNAEDENIFKKEFQNVFMNGPADEKGLTYSFDFDRIHFVFVTTDRWGYSEADEDAGGERDWHYIKHLDWLSKDLKDARERGAKYFFVMGHETAFPIGGHLRDGLPNLGRNFTLPLDSTRQWYINQRDKFWNILRENNVTAYICGHEHLYGRESIDSVYQITSGSCGAPLYHFNPVYGYNPVSKIEGQELTYDQALPYYKVLNYHYEPGGNAQASKDFVGKRAFVYVLFHVEKNQVTVETYGTYPKSGTNKESNGKIELLDKFVIEKKL